MDERTFEDARRRVAAPAMGLIIVSAISGVMLLLALAFDMFLLFSGVAGEMRQPNAMSKEAQITIRAVWSVLMLAVSASIIAGAVRMKGLRGRGLSMLACVLAIIPCLGPCFLLGIPFGIWGLVVLNDPQVRRAFES